MPKSVFPRVYARSFYSTDTTDIQGYDQKPSGQGKGTVSAVHGRWKGNE